ncbi:MAG: hypothetical protein QOK21_1861 [Solirubrobacteraceae bacterium]|jgi:hypothetical protein|nr:hypothetical protein [Solirubrobacteraceae bacterium]
MPHLHLPAEHSDADLMLAANLADIVGSEDLFVTWTHERGPGAIPQVEAVLRDERPSPLLELAGAVVAGLASLWRTFFSTAAATSPAVTPAPLSERAPS